MNLKITAWAAIIAAVIYIPSYFLGIALGFMPDSKILNLISIADFIIGIAIMVAFFLGYLRVARLNKMRFLEVMVYIAFIASIFISLYALLTFKIESPFIGMSLLFLYALAGITELIMGVAILGLRKTFGGLVTAIGILYIINGAFLASILFSALMPITGVAVNVLEAIFFFRASKKYDKK
jgi:hypothetical protein